MKTTFISFSFLLLSSFYGIALAEPLTRMDGVIPNPNVDAPIPRCGQTRSSDPCVLYVMNGSRNDRLAEDFFEEAAHQTGRAKYVIHIDNASYAKLRIPPGYFAEIRIPALK